MNLDMEEIEINGKKYVLKGSENLKAENVDGMDYVIIRGDRSGVFAGYLKSRKDREVELVKSRRIWYWDGAASISQLAVDGTSKPENCKFPCVVENQWVLDVVEVIPCTEKSRKSIEGVVVWEK